MNDGTVILKNKIVDAVRQANVISKTWTESKFTYPPVIVVVKVSFAEVSSTFITVPAGESVAYYTSTSRIIIIEILS